MGSLSDELRRIDLAHTGFTEDYCPSVSRKTIRAAAAAIEAGADDATRAALKCAVEHIEHMAAWIGRLNSGYSFESLGEDMPGITASLNALTAKTSFQQRVQPWMLACFGAEISADVSERNHRFLEEALELVQSTGCTASEAHQLVDYVFGREIGETPQEIGGVMVTLAALCLAIGHDMHLAGETELARIWTKVEKIRAKQAAKPKHSPLPQHVEPATSDYVVWSNEHRAWWGPNRAGYYTTLEAAGRYDRDAALAICDGARGGRQYNDNPSEVPVLFADAERFWPNDKPEWSVVRFRRRIASEQEESA